MGIRIGTYVIMTGSAAGRDMVYLQVASRHGCGLSTPVRSICRTVVISIDIYLAIFLAGSLPITCSYTGEVPLYRAYPLCRIQLSRQPQFHQQGYQPCTPVTNQLDDAISSLLCSRAHCKGLDATRRICQSGQDTITAPLARKVCR